MKSKPKRPIRLMPLLDENFVGSLFGFKISEAKLIDAVRIGNASSLLQQSTRVKSGWITHQTPKRESNRRRKEAYVVNRARRLQVELRSFGLPSLPIAMRGRGRSPGRLQICDSTQINRLAETRGVGHLVEIAHERLGLPLVLKDVSQWTEDGSHFKVGAFYLVHYLLRATVAAAKSEAAVARAYYDVYLPLKKIAN